MPWIKQDLDDEDRPDRSESRQGRLFNNHDRLSGQANGPSVWDNSNSELPKIPKPSSEDKPAKKYILSRRVFFLMLFCGLFALVWVFSLGVLAGRGKIFESELFQKVEGLLGLEHQEEIVPVAEVKVKPPDTEPQEPAKKPELTFYDTLNQKKPKAKRAVEGPMTKPTPPTQPVRAAVKPAAKPPPEKPAKEKPVKEKPVKEKPVPIKPEFKIEATVKKPVKKEKPGVKTVKEKSVAPPPMRAPGENFTVQVAAATNIPDAEKAVRELRRKGFDAYYYQVELKGKQYFRVRVGRYERIEQARITKARLLAEGHEGIFISKLQD